MVDTADSDELEREEPAHIIDETRNWDAIAVALQPIAEQGRLALIERTRLTEEGLTARLTISEGGNTNRMRSQTRIAAFTLIVVTAAVTGLALFAMLNGNSGLAEKIVFGLFAFVGGFAVRR